MKVYVVVDNIWFEDMKVFSNKDEAIDNTKSSFISKNSSL